MSGAPGDDASPLAGTEVHYLRSAHVGDEFKLFVGRCGVGPGTRPGVLYLTDGNGFFGATVDLVRSMQLSAHPPAARGWHRLPEGRHPLSRGLRCLYDAPR